MPVNHETYISNELPGIGRVLVSIYTTTDAKTDKLRSEILYWARRNISGGMRIFADHGQVGPVAFDEAFMHIQAREWIENQIIYEQNELYLKTRDQCFISIRPEFKIIDDGGITRIWFGNVESFFVRYVHKNTEHADLRIIMERVMRLPQIELLPIDIPENKPTKN